MTDMPPPPPPQPAPPPPGAPTGGTLPKKSSAGRWVLIGLGVFGVLVVLAVIAGILAGPPEPDPPVVVPDLVGLPLAEAREAVDGLELDVEEVDPQGRAILAVGNWLVEATDPAAGVEVEPGSVLTLLLVNVRDLDAEQAAEEVVEDEPEPDPAPEPDPEPEVVADEPDPNPEPADEPDDTEDIQAEIIATIEQGFQLFMTEPVTLAEAMDDPMLWGLFETQQIIEAGVDVYMTNDFVRIGTSLHRGGAGVILDSEEAAQGLCNVAMSDTYNYIDDIIWIEVEAVNGNRLARCQHTDLR